MRNDIYIKYFQKRNNSLKDNNLDDNSRRVFETFNSALEYFNHNIIKKNDHLVDIGCGDRSFIDFLKQVGINSSGYDIDDDINFEINKFPNIDNSVDHVVTNSVIEHIYNPNNFLSEIKRILKKNGNLIIVTPNFRFSYKEFYDDPTHVKPYTEESLKKILEMYEFNDIKILPWFVKKPKIYWKIPKKFFFGSIIPFRGDSSRLIPEFLKGQTKSLLAICKK